MAVDRKIRVLIADPQLLFWDALKRSLRDFSDIEVLEEHPQSGGATVDMVELLQPDVVLVEYWMDVILGPAIAKAIKPKVPDCKLIVLTWLHGTREILNSLYAGATSFIPKAGSTVDQIAEAIRLAAAGESELFKKQQEAVLQTLRERDERAFELWEKMKGISPRELQILALLSLAKPLKEIGASLSITPRTARNHLDNMLKKTGAQSQVELLVMARQCGLIAG